MLLLVLALAMVLIGCWSLYLYFSAPALPITDPFRLQAIKAASRQIVAAMPEPAVPGLMYLHPLVADERDLALTRHLIARLDDAGKYKCLEVDSLLAYCREHKLATDLSEETILRLAAHFHADLAAWGKIVRFSKTAAGSELIIALSLYSMRQQRYLFRSRLFAGKLEPGFTLSYYRARLAAQSAWLRFFAWLLATLLMPFFLHKQVTAALDRESNIANFYLLVGFTAFSILLAGALSGFDYQGFTAGATTLSAALGASLYNYVVLSWLEYQRK